MPTIVFSIRDMRGMRDKGLSGDQHHFEGDVSKEYNYLKIRIFLEKQMM